MRPVSGFLAAAVTLAASVVGAVGLPEGVKVSEAGKVEFPGGSVSVWVPQVGWMGAVRFDKGVRAERDGAIVHAGDCRMGDVTGRYEYRFRPISKTEFAAEWRYGMASAIDTAVSCAEIDVNHADVKGVFVDGVYRTLPLAAGKEWTFHPKSLAFVLEGGRTLSVRHGNVHYIDCRRFGNDASGFRLLMDRPHGRVATNVLRTVFALGDVPQAACPLPLAAGRPLDGLAPSGETVNGGVRFSIGERMLALERDAVSVPLPTNRVIRGLSLVHAVDGTLGEGVVVGRIEVTGADGTAQILDVVYGADVGSAEGLHDLRNAKPACKKWNIVRFDGLYASHFPLSVRNPISMTLKPVRGTWLVAAATATDAPVSFKAYGDKPVEIQAGKDWAPISFTGDTVKGSVLDFSGFADAPAGKDGFVQVSPSGDFILGKTGRRIRFNGANIIGQPLVADAADVEEMASRMVRCGLNAIRFHHFARELIGPDAKTGMDFDPDRLDRFFRTWAICANHGLYISYDVYASREVFPGEIPGVTNRHGLAVYKARLPINRGYVENLKTFCRRLLLQRNPYRGFTLAEDPAVMGVNLVNEEDIGLYWMSAREDWARAYGDWCANHAGLDPTVGQTNPDFNRFLYGRLAALHRELFTFCRDEIGIKAPITSMNMTDRLDLTPLAANFEWVDKHCYYSHPNKLDPRQGSMVPNAYAQPGSPIESLASPAPRQIAISHVAGKPMGSTEYNFCYPNAYRHEGVPLFMAYAAYQGWDATFRFMWSCGPWSLNRPFRAVPFEETSDPIMQLSDRVAAALFLRGDLATAARGYVFAVSPADAMGGTRSVASAADFDGADLLALVSRVAATSDAAHLPAGWRVLGGADSLDPADARALSAAREVRRATTPDGQIDLDGGNHTLRIVTPRTEVLSAGKGELKGAALSLGNIRGFQTLAAISLDGRSLAETGKAVLIHLPDIQNTGVKFNNELKTVQMTLGELPYLVRRVKAEVSLRTAQPLKVTALSGDGRPLGAVRTTFADGVLQFTADPAAFPDGVLAYSVER